MKYAFNACAAAVALACSSIAMAAGTGGFSTATGGASATQITISNYADLVTELTALQKAKSTTPTVIYYTGNEDTLIAAAKANVCGQYGKTSRTIDVKRISNLTILGADGSSANFGFNMVDSSNIIIRNMTFAMMPGGLSSDGITVDSSTNVWLDHNTLYTRNYTCPDAPGDGHDGTFDGLIDIKKTADNVTVSYNYIHDHHKVGLDGYTTNDVARNVTYHHNYYDNVGARLPLQRHGLIHVYNNYYNRIGYEDMNADGTGNVPNGGSGINVRQAGQALIQNNFFENSQNPVTCRYDSSNCGTWDLRNNNITSASDFTKYNITWTDGGTGSVDATTWTSTATLTLPSYMSTVEPVNAQCVKDQLFSYAGAGKGLAELVASKCSGSSTSSSSSSAASSSSSSTASSSSSSKSSSSSSTASSSSSSKSSSSSSSSSSASTAPVLTGTGDYPDGFSKCSDLGGTCAVPSGTGWVAFGRKGSWVTAYVGVGKSIACTVAAFGSDPVGNPNKCSYQK